MKRWKLIFIILTFFFVSFVCSIGRLDAASKIGAGFILGDPSGLTAKLFFDNDYAVDCGIGPSAYDGFYFYGDFLRHFGDLFPVKELVFYVGVGAGFQNHDRYHHDKRNDDEDENSLEVRMPFGVEYTFKNIPIGLFIEIAPATEFVPDFDFNIRGGTGARYYF